MTDIEYGIKIIYRDGSKDTKWFATERLRDNSLFWHKREARIKSAKPTQRKKR